MASLAYSLNGQNTFAVGGDNPTGMVFGMYDITLTHVSLAFSATKKHDRPMSEVITQFAAFLDSHLGNITNQELADGLGADNVRRITDLFSFGWVGNFARGVTVATANAVPNLPHQAGTSAVTVVFAIMASLATLAVGLRIWSREVLMLKLMMHDWLMIAGYFFAMIYGIISVIHGSLLIPTVTVWDLSYNTYAEANKYQTILSVIYPVPLFFIKSSLLVFYLRLCPSYPSEARNIFRTSIFGTFFFILSTAITNIFVILLQCDRIDFWTEEITTRCGLNPKVTQVVLGAIGVITDILLWLMPLPLVWGLKLGKREKFLAVITFGLGAVVCVVSAFRLNAIQLYGYVNDGRVLSPIVNYLTIIELMLAIICASAPAIRALILHYMPRLLNAYTQAQASRKASTASSRDLKDDEERSTYTIQVGINAVRGREEYPALPGGGRTMGGNGNEGEKRVQSPPRRGISCKLYIDGEPAVELATKTKRRRCETYVVPEEGKRYSIRLRFEDTGAQRHGVDFWVDGQNLGSWTTKEPKHRIKTAKYAFWKQDDAGFWEYRRLFFDKLNIDKKGASKNIETRRHRLRNIGKIEVNVHRESPEPYETDCVYQDDGFSPLGAIPAKHTRRNKLSHGTKLSENACYVQRQDSYLRVTDLDWFCRAYTKFVFFYASEDMLRARGILKKEYQLDDDLVAMNTVQLQQEVMRLRSKWSWWPFKKSKKVPEGVPNVDEKTSLKKADGTTWKKVRFLF
ncbi:hypothetical protein H072_10136 [Dactylellina haptotyla CBS 200.50]|uniref:Uncharacterized protein n=1 Tax=Dactylellina haptotyla (strain CBS 200.50) TaxID=1284197 RepID=S8A5J5_DACHA|nr:hypothetical protein H072_10136 [Dactylellina haptotyla CBS 200.50]